jgi:hypothetical protein
MSSPARKKTRVYSSVEDEPPELCASSNDEDEDYEEEEEDEDEDYEDYEEEDDELDGGGGDGGAAAAGAAADDDDDDSGYEKDFDDDDDDDDGEEEEEEEEAKCVGKELAAEHPRSTATADEKAAVLILANVRATVLALSTGRGSRTAEAQTILDCVSAAVMSQNIVDRRLVSAISRCVGLTGPQQTRGLQLRRMREQDQSLVVRLPRVPHSHGKRAYKNLDWM